jgi:hypothetical protein
VPDLFHPAPRHSTIASLTHLLAMPRSAANISYAGSINDEAARRKVSYGKLPLSFEANRGQTDARVKFTARGVGYNLFLTRDETVLNLQKHDGNVGDLRRSVLSEDEMRADCLCANAPSASSKSTSAVVRMKPIGANSRAQVTGEDERTDKSKLFYRQR